MTSIYERKREGKIIIIIIDIAKVVVSCEAQSRARKRAWLGKYFFILLFLMEILLFLVSII